MAASYTLMATGEAGQAFCSKTKRRMFALACVTTLLPRGRWQTQQLLSPARDTHPSVPFLHAGVLGCPAAKPQLLQQFPLRWIAWGGLQSHSCSLQARAPWRKAVRNQRVNQTPVLTPVRVL